MSSRDDAVYLHHILDAIAKIEEYLTGVDETIFAQRSLVQDGVIRQLEIIGEAVRRLSPEARGQQPGIPWRDIAAMRNKLTNEYFGIDRQAGWLTANRDVPALKASVLAILQRPVR
jgi:uncharacterized protein with HEPN domain